MRRDGRIHIPPIAIVLALLILFVASQYPHVLWGPFVGDDYLFLEKTRGASFPSLWGFHALAFNYYRPWSRELHYWLLQNTFGMREIAFHLASGTLWIAAMLLYFVLVRELAGSAAAAVATAGVAALAAWGVLLIWAAGSQDLWMLVFGLLALLAFVRGRRGWAVTFEGLALISKETAAVIPLLALCHGLLVERMRLGTALRRTAPFLFVLVPWVIFHPMLGRRVVHPIDTSTLPGLHQPAASIVARTLLSLINLDEWPHPTTGWHTAIFPAIAGAVFLVALVVFTGRRASRDGRTTDPARDRSPDTIRLLIFGACWAVLGWLPLLMPSLGWHAYYGLLGTIGAWFAIAVALRGRLWLAVSLIACLALVRAGRATTRSRDWGNEWFQRRAARFVEYTRRYLRDTHPMFPPHSRIYFITVPGNVGLVPGGEESAALRVWYGDSTLQTRYASRYRLRDPREPRGNDYFFHYDSLRGWREVIAGPEPFVVQQAKDATWKEEHTDLAIRLWNAQNYRDCAVECEKLAGVYPDRVDFPFDAGACHEKLGDLPQAARWYARAASLPGATPEMKSAAERLGAYAKP